MRILFLCGSLEPGRDGVGDYCQRLASELYLQGHETALLGLNDIYLQNDLVLGRQTETGISLPQLRLTAFQPDNIRFKKAKDWIENFNPDWVSLQFVIFSFHPKGLPLQLARNLLTLNGKWQWHIMFHELWVGKNTNRSIKLVIWGHLQRKIIKQLILTLKPTRIDTHTRIYQAQLKKNGFDAGYLPLFGNIPVHNSIKNNSKAESHVNSKQVIRLVIFGSILSSTLAEEFAQEAAAYAHEFKKEISLTIVGISGPENKKWESAFQSAGLETEILGEQPSEIISDILGRSTLGISTVPVVAAEKSGTIAAMREHGLSVLSVSLPWKASKELEFNPIPGIVQYKPGIFKKVLEKNNDDPRSTNVKLVAAELVNSFIVTNEGILQT